VALINSNLTGEPLAHALGIVAPRHVIVGAELSRALAAVRSRLAAGVGCSAHGPGAHDLPRLDLEVAGLPGEPLRPAERAPPALVVRERFSVSRFWQDVAAERCTLFQYIGELCRYLVNAPHQAAESQHVLRLACGNGLRGEVWREFQQRFRIPQILEYYAATEGNFSLYNCEGRPGSIGRIPPFLAHRMPVEIVRFDVEAGAPLRDARGHCVRCAADEVGEAIGQILDDHGTTRFEGYADPAASRSKVLREAFSTGDAWYRSGDLMRRDAQGFFYFVDRVGDTFRWKGENVSTTEVADVIGRCRGVTEVAVYGVPVPEADGRAGMAAIVTGAGFELAELHRKVTAELPPYARLRHPRPRSGAAARFAALSFRADPRRASASSACRRIPAPPRSP